MPKITKDDISKIANLPDQVKADLFSLHDEATTKDQEIVKLRKENQDADAIVKNAPKLEAAVKERDESIKKLMEELGKHTGKKKSEITLTAFAPFFGTES